MPLQDAIPDRLKFRWRPFVLRRREAWWKAHAGEVRSFLFDVQPGVRLRLHLDSELSRLIYCRHFESTERAFLNAFLRPGDTFVDVGANIGLFTVIAASRVGPRGRVFSFEPTPETFARLIENVEANGFEHVSCQQLALSDQTGNLEITKSLDGFDAWNSLAQPKMGERFATAKIPTMSWDGFAQEHDLVGRVTMMKIDVEGWESRVLLGARQFLSRSDAPTLQVEFTDGAAMAAGSSCCEIYNLLEEFGYTMFLFDPGKRALVLDPLRSEYPNANLFAFGYSL